MPRLLGFKNSILKLLAVTVNVVSRNAKHSAFLAGLFAFGLTACSRFQAESISSGAPSAQSISAAFQPEDFRPTTATVDEDEIENWPEAEKVIGQNENKVLLGKLRISDPKIAVDASTGEMQFKGFAKLGAISQEIDLRGRTDEDGFASLFPTADPDPKDKSKLIVRAKATCLERIAGGRYACDSLFVDVYAESEGVRYAAQYNLTRGQADVPGAVVGSGPKKNGAQSARSDQGKANNRPVAPSGSDSSQGKTAGTSDSIPSANADEVVVKDSVVDSKDQPTRTVPVPSSEEEKSKNKSLPGGKSESETEKNAAAKSGNGQAASSGKEDSGVHSGEGAKGKDSAVDHAVDEDDVPPIIETNEQGQTVVHEEPVTAPGLFVGHRREVDQLFKAPIPAASAAKPTNVPATAVPSSPVPSSSPAPIPALVVPPKKAETSSAKPADNSKNQVGSTSPVKSDGGSPKSDPEKAVDQANVRIGVVPSAQSPASAPPKPVNKNGSAAADNVNVSKSPSPVPMSEPVKTVVPEPVPKTSAADKPSNAAPDENVRKNVEKVKDKPAENRPTAPAKEEPTRVPPPVLQIPTPPTTRTQPPPITPVQPKQPETPAKPPVVVTNSSVDIVHPKVGPVATEPSGTVRPADQSRNFYSNGTLERASELKPSASAAYFLVNGAGVGNFGSYVMVEFIDRLAKYVRTLIPDYVLGVGSISKKNGGLFQGHSSHQNGLDADITYITTDQPPRFQDIRASGRPGGLIDKLRKQENWLVFKKMIQTGLVSQVGMDEGVRKGFCQFAKEIGEPEGGNQVMQYFSAWPGHADHFHVRLKCTDFNPRCQNERVAYEQNRCK